jgi:hypothetical protein
MVFSWDIFLKARNVQGLIQKGERGKSPKPESLNNK